MGILLTAIQTSGYAQRDRLEDKSQELAWTDHSSETCLLFSIALRGESLKSVIHWRDDIYDYTNVMRGDFSLVYIVNNPNARFFSTLDMAGNVWNWCSDWYDPDYYSNSSVKNSKGPSSGKNKVIRGGSWESIPSTLRSSFRGGNDPPSLKASTLGFRCVRE